MQGAHLMTLSPLGQAGNEVKTRMQQYANISAHGYKSVGLTSFLDFWPKVIHDPKYIDDYMLMRYHK